MKECKEDNEDFSNISETKTFYDLIKMCEIVNKKLGYDQRDCGKHFFPDSVEVPHMDFWHYQIDHCVPYSFCNDSYSTIKIGELEDDAEEWQKEIQAVWYETFKDIVEDDYDVPTVSIWICW